MAYLGAKGKYLGQRLTQAREYKGLTKTKLAELVGTDYNSIHRYEKGQRKPNTQLLEQLAKVLDVNVEWLISDETYPSDYRQFKKVHSIPIKISKTYTGTIEPPSLDKQISFEEMEVIQYIKLNVSKVSKELRRTIYDMIREEIE